MIHSRSVGCPDDQALRAMFEQTLEPPRMRELETHVESCPTCRGAMHSLATGPTALGTPPPGSEPTAAPLDEEVALGERYEVKHLLGRGGMGAVYLARDLTLGRDIAVKLHGAGSGGDRLQREAIAMAKLAHPNVVTVFEVASHGDRLYVAMEYVRGGTLRSWLTAGHRTWREKLAKLIEAGEGLAAAHAAGLIHRDYKPENVHVGEDGRARVSDFGIAHLGARTSEQIIPLVPDSDVQTPMTVTGAVMGTPAYMSPEQLSGDPIDARSDQFAFCIVAWEVLFGVRPFLGSTMASLAVAIERQELARPSKSDVPQRVVDLVARGLRPAPEERHADLPALLAQLRAASTRSTRKWLAFGALAAAVPVAVVVTAVTAGSRAPAADACAVAPTELAGAWDAGIKDKLAATFAKARPKDGKAIAARAGEQLDRYADGWIAARRQACEATRVRKEQTDATLALRMTCLDRKRDELAALTRGLVEADARIALGATRAVMGLSPLAVCEDVAALSAPMPPSAQIMREQVEVARAELSAARALRLLGKAELALAKAEAAAKVAQDLAYRPLEAEALLVAGDLKDRTGDSTSAVKLLEQAAIAANASNHRLVAVEAWSALAWVLGLGERNFERADWAITMARAALEAVGGHAELGAQLTHYEGLILDAKGKLPAAREKLLAAQAVYEQLGQRESAPMSIVLNDLGGIERKLGNLDAAQEIHTRALALRMKLFGDVHPWVFSSLNNLGTVAWSRHDYAAAETWFQKALACGLEVFPEKHPQIALVLYNLASLYDQQQKLDDSVAMYRRALAMYEALRGPEHPDVADALRAIGNVLRQQDKVDEAAASFERALKIIDAKKDVPLRVKLLADYGELLIVKAPKRAEAMLREAQSIVEAESKTDPELGYSLTALGDLYTATKRPALAKDVLERALAIRTADADTDAEDLAHTELSLAKALWTVRAERPHALELARSAKQRLEAAKQTQRKAYRVVTAWLHAHDRR